MTKELEDSTLSLLLCFVLFCSLSVWGLVSRCCRRTTKTDTNAPDGRDARVSHNKLLYTVVVVVGAIALAHIAQTSNVPPNNYTLLNLDATATSPAIRARFRELSRTEHPDKGGNATRFMNLENARKVLSDSKSREMYSRFGHLSCTGDACGTEPHHFFLLSMAAVEWTISIVLVALFALVATMFSIRRSRVVVPCRILLLVNLVVHFYVVFAPSTPSASPLDPTQPLFVFLGQLRSFTCLSIALLVLLAHFLPGDFRSLEEIVKQIERDQKLIMDKVDHLIFQLNPSNNQQQ